MTPSEFYGEDVKHKHHKKDEPKNSQSKYKDEKTVLLKSTTNEHDVLTKVRQMTKWVEKNHPVRVLIGQPGETGSPENVYKIIENAVKDQPMRIVQKVVKNGQVKFQVLPPKEIKTTPNKAPVQPKQETEIESDSEDEKEHPAK